MATTSSSLIYPHGANKHETALDHAVALFSINGPKAGQGVDLSGRRACRCHPA